jgi:hypothetical protein
VIRSKIGSSDHLNIPEVAGNTLINHEWGCGAMDVFTAGAAKAAVPVASSEARQRNGTAPQHSISKDSARGRHWSSCEQCVWLLSRRADFWLACGGASMVLFASILLIIVRGDRELDAMDLVLSEFHLGATYHAVVQRRLWRRLPGDVLVVPFVILVITYALALSGQTILLTSIAMYAAVWHRGRQSLGVARFYQRTTDEPASSAHYWLFRGAIYLPMVAALLAYSHLAPLEYEGEPYFAIDFGVEITSTIAIATSVWVAAYFAWVFWQSRSAHSWGAPCDRPFRLHPGESWVVLSHVVAFGSGYVLGTSNASFLLVLALHHEVQYLSFAYAMSRRFNLAQLEQSTKGGIKECRSTGLSKKADDVRSELQHVASFLLWPVLGFGGALAGSWLSVEWLAPLGAGALFCHYWLDGRIWTRRSFGT